MTKPRTAETSDLPPGVIIRRRASADYYYYQTSSVGQKRKEYSLGKVKAVAIQRWQEIAREAPVAKRKVGLRPWLGKELHGTVKANAKRRGIEFLLSLEDIESLLAESKGKCSLTGIEFDLFREAGVRVRHWAPSIDRINCARGYVPGNVRLVVCAVNMALNDFGEDVLMRIAKGMIKMKYGKII